jgi:transcription antitermination factor NusG
MKKVFLFLAAVSLTASAFAGTTLRYYNEDSKDYKLKVVTCGNHTEVEFDHSKTTSVTIQGCSDATISTPNDGELKVKDGDKVHIKDGHFKVVSSL